MKSGYCTTMWNGRDRGTSEMNHHQPHQRQVFIQRRWHCVYGGIEKGVLYYELLPENQTINSNKYCSQLDQVKAALEEKRPELVNRKLIIFCQDSAWLHVSLMTRQKLLQLGWEVLVHPPCSPDIAPSDFHWFRSWQNSLNGKNFNSLEDCKRYLERWNVLGRWNYAVAWKMAEGSGTKGWICCSIKFWVKMKNVSFIFT